MRAYVLLLPAYAPYISSTPYTCTMGHMQGERAYIYVCGDFFIYPIEDVELCLILIMRSYDNTIKPYSSNIYIYNS